MYVVRTFEIALDRAETVGDAMRRARGALAAVDSPAIPVRIFLSDTFSGSSKGCARVTRAFPELAPLACEVEGGQVVSSFDEGVAGSAAVLDSALDHARAQKLADGVPRSFPLNDSHFFFGPVPPLLSATGRHAPVRPSGRPHTDSVPGEIALLSQWWITRRRTRLVAAASADLPPAGALDLPPVPEETAELVTAMGGVRRERRRVVPSSTGEEEMLIRRVALGEERLRQIEPSLARAPLGFPHPVLAGAGGDEYRPGADLLNAVFGPRGYRRRPMRTRSQWGGVWLLTKRTRRHNELELRVDRGPINGRVSARLILCGPLWRHHLGDLPLAPGELELRVASDEDLRRVLDNLAVAVDRAEERIVPPLEEIHGDGFAWLSAVTG